MALAPQDPQPRGLARGAEGVAYSLLSFAAGAFVACAADPGDALNGEISDAASASVGSTGSTDTSESASTDMDGAALDGAGAGAALDGAGAALDVLASSAADSSAVADSSIVEDTSIVRDTSVEDALAADTSAGEASNEAGLDAAVSDASNGGSDAADAAVCVTMWPDGGTNLVSNPSFESESVASAWSAQFGGGTFGVSSTM